MVKHYYKHLGHFNEVGDIRELSQKSADKILDYYKNGCGSFYENDYHEDDCDLIAEEEVGHEDVRFTEDKKFAIVDGSWLGWQEDYKDCEEGDDSDCFIDIYELYKEIKFKDKTYEVCPHCENEVELDAELKVQKCPVCGKMIVTCSMCRNSELNYKCSSDCCLSVLAHSLNAENED